MILEVINLAVSGAAIISTILTATKLHRIQRKNKNIPPPPAPAIPAKIIKKKTKTPTNKRKHEGTLPWSIYGAHGTQYGFRCPKCINVAKNKKQYPICTCDDYPREHYHFCCGDCKYTNVLRTADDI